MTALLKTLFGDLRNCGVVGLLIIAEAVMIRGGWGEFAPFVIPLLTLSGTFWLARSWRSTARTGPL
jgi:hypothetical protein